MRGFDIFFIVLSGCVLLIALLIAGYAMHILKRLENIMEQVLSEDILNEHFDESRVSRIESKLIRILEMNRLSQEKLQKERDCIKENISDLSHQTKTPLTNILAYSELLEEQPLKSSGREIAEQIGKQSEKLNFLIQTLVKVSRLETNAIKVTPKKQSVNRLLKEAAGEFKEMAEKKQICFTVEESQANLTFDYKWTREALGNLIENALKYTPKGGKVSVFVKEYSMFIAIVVKDNGPGIKKEEQAKIFTRFYRGSMVQEEEGVGIGLYLVRCILSKESGYIKVGSSFGKGAEFWMFLPV